MLVTATMRPSPDAVSRGSSARVIRIVPSTFASYIQRHCSSSACVERAEAERAAGVVDQHVAAPHPRGERLDRVRVGDVEGDGLAADLGRDFLQPLEPAGTEHHLEAVAGQRPCRSRADPAGSPGNYRDSRHFQRAYRWQGGESALARAWVVMETADAYAIFMACEPRSTWMTISWRR